MRAEADKYSLVAGDYLSQGVPLVLPVALPWPEVLRWKAGGWERKAAEGFNVFKLMFAADDKQYKSPFWLSLRDGEAVGGQLKKGAAGVNTATWRWSTKKGSWAGDISPHNVENIDSEIYTAEEGDLAVAMRPQVLFNAQEWEGITNLPAFIERILPTTEEVLERAARIEERAAGCEIRYGGTLAYYNPTLNYISIPPMEQFAGPKAYYWALFEQIGHALASKHQLDLWGGEIEEEMAKDPSFKALYAKMTAAMLAYETGIDVL